MKFAVSFVFLLPLGLWARSPMPNQRLYKLEKMEFSTAHAVQPVSGELFADFKNRKLRLEVQEAMPPCPDGMDCAQVLPEPVVVELPIVSLIENKCGILRAKAREDDRAMGGKLKEIRIEDVSNLRCPTLVPAVSTAVFETVPARKGEGAVAADVSRMQLKIKNQPALSLTWPTFELAQGQLVEGFRIFEKPAFGNLKIKENEIEMYVGIGLDCEGGPCPAYMPRPLQVVLPIIRRTPSSCGDLIEAESIEELENGTLKTRIELLDYRFVSCRRFFEFPLRAKYTEIETVGHRQSFKNAVFDFKSLPKNELVSEFQ